MKVDIRELRGDMKAANQDIGLLRVESARQYAELRGALRLAILTSTVGQLLTAGAILGVVGRALKWFDDR